VCDPEPLEQRLDGSSAGTEGDVRADAQVREEGVVLEHEADPPLLGREGQAALGVEPGFPVERHAPAARLRESRDDTEDGRLAGAGGPDECDRARDVEREL
jgi:hypothetical protein